MATLIIRLEVNPQTGKKNVYVKYDSDADALPLEHEDEHKRLVSALLQGGVVSAEELGDVHIEREGQGEAPRAEAESAPAAEGLKSPS